MLETFLSSINNGERQLIFIDEIQWMDTPKSGFMTAFEAFWNGWACNRHNIMVIVCGSSTSWVLDKLINNHGGLYDRLTRQIHLNPFSLSECEQFLISNGVIFSRYDIVQTYMIMGGIPYYLKYIDRTKSLAQNIDELFFEKNATLRDEFGRLFQSIFTNPDTMMLLVKTIGSKKRGLTRQEIIDEANIKDSGSFSKFLRALIEGGFIIKYVPFSENKRQDYYKLVDPLCLFSLRFLMDNKINSWLNNLDSQRIVVWKGIAFENVCFNHVKQIKNALGISGVYTKESLWTKAGEKETSGTQIDLVIDRNDNVIDLCEAKFLSNEFTVDKDYHLILESSKSLIKECVSKKKSVQNVLISTYGLKRNEYYWDFSSSITIDAFFID